MSSDAEFAMAAGDASVGSCPLEKWSNRPAQLAKRSAANALAAPARGAIARPDTVLHVVDT
jgi:hypothetical protein